MRSIKERKSGPISRWIVLIITETFVCILRTRVTYENLMAFLYTLPQRFSNFYSEFAPNQ